MIKNIVQTVAALVITGIIFGIWNSEGFRATVVRILYIEPIYSYWKKEQGQKREGDAEAMNIYIGLDEDGKRLVIFKKQEGDKEQERDSPYVTKKELKAKVQSILEEFRNQSAGVQPSTEAEPAELKSLPGSRKEDGPPAGKTRSPNGTQRELSASIAREPIVDLGGGGYAPHDAAQSESAERKSLDISHELTINESTFCLKMDPPECNIPVSGKTSLSYMQIFKNGKPRLYFWTSGRVTKDVDIMHVWSSSNRRDSWAERVHIWRSNEPGISARTDLGSIKKDLRENLEPNTHSVQAVILDFYRSPRFRTFSDIQVVPGTYTVEVRSIGSDEPIPGGEPKTIIIE